MSTNKQANRLIHEKSPYLLQHAYNPVNWYPWGEEVFEKAAAEDKPIFLSIGYSTCHWCHVMERESFEDEEVAAVLNEKYISIKVDREERPDVDHIYMSVCQALTGSGGWPLTIIMTPDKKPFYAGTYFPKRTRMGYPGIIEILEYISEAWKNDREALIKSSEEIVMHIKKESKQAVSGEISMDTIDKAFKSLMASFDNTYGGFGSAPKFPMPHNLSFLLRYWKATRREEALNMVEKTLDSMYKGGIFDHIGYGFSRYSTDNKWLVPHFEKMLYDNALLAIAYLEAYQAIRKEKYAVISSQIFEYIVRDMTSPEGGFYSAEDADSEGEEGKFYIWSQAEIIEILGETDGKKFIKHFDISKAGNFEGKNIPNLIQNKDSLENIFDIYNTDINMLKNKLFQERKKRIPPYKDDKILASWNGLMIAALSIGARVLKNTNYSDAAEKAIKFINENMRREDGRLLARYRAGEAAYPAYLDDYAFLVWGLIELYEAIFKPEYLKLAIELNSDMLKYFHDDENGGLYIYGSDGEHLIARPKDVYDGAIPSGNSVAAMNFLRLARLTGNSELERKSDMLFNAFAGQVNSYAVGHSYFLMAVLFSKVKGREIVVVGEKDNDDTESMINIMNSNFLPYSVSVLKDISVKNKDISDLIPFIEEQHMINNKTTAYICEGFSCREPITDIDEFKNIINDIQQ